MAGTAEEKAVKDRAKALTAEQAGAVPTRVTGEAGPLRLFSEKPFTGSTPYESSILKGHAGSFVCDSCLTVAESGIYLVGKKWLCANCKRSARSYGGSASASLDLWAGVSTSRGVRTRCTSHKRG
jgi:hypothetical protein